MSSFFYFQHSKNLVDIHFNPFHSNSTGGGGGCGGSGGDDIKQDNDNDDENNKDNNLQIICTDSLHISNSHLKENSEPTSQSSQSNQSSEINQKKSILEIAATNNLKCSVLEALCKKTSYWMTCMAYRIFCQGKKEHVTSFDEEEIKLMGKANLIFNHRQAEERCHFGDAAVRSELKRNR
eukprot:gene2563-2962_t